MFHDEGLDRKPVFRGFFDVGHIADAAHGHVQRTGDRGCGKRQYVHAAGKLLDVLLVRHAEALLLIHHQKAEVFELHVLGQQAVGADDQVAFSGLQVFDGPAVLPADAHPAQLADFHREAEKALHCGLIVLLGQNRGRDQDRGLFSVQDAFHYRPEGHLGLSEAHVAAEQTVHRDGGLHILLDLGCTAELIVRLRIGEVFFKFPLPAAVRRECITRQPLPLGVEGDQLPCHVLRRALGPGAGLGPLGSAHFGEPDRALLSAAGVLGHHVQLRCGDIEHVRSGIAELDVVLFKPVDLHFDDSGKTADAVGFVDDIVPYGEVGIALDALAVGREFSVGFLFVLPANQLRVRQDRQFQGGVLNSGGERADADTALALAGQRLHLRPDQHRRAVLPQKLLQDLRPALISRQDHHPVILLQVDLQILRRSLGISRIGGQLLGRDAQERLRLEVSPAEGERVSRIERETLQLLPDLVRREAEALRLKGAAPVLLQGTEVLAQLFPVFLCHFAAAGRLIHKDDRVLRDIIKAGRRGIEQRQPSVKILHDQLGAEFLRILPERGGNLSGRRAAPPFLVPVCQFLHLPTQGFRTAGCQRRQRFRRRKDPALCDGLVPPLAGDIEIAHGVDLIAPELHTYRLFLRRRKQIKDPAAACKLAGTLHLFRTLVAAADEGLFQVLNGVGLRRRDGKRRSLQQFFRDGPLQHGRDGSHRYRVLALLRFLKQGREDFQPLLFRPA